MMTCLQAGTSNLGQATFKMIKNVNLMRFLQSKGEEETNQKFSKLKEEIDARQRFREQQLEEHKAAMLAAKEKKRQAQSDSRSFWSKQIDWKQQQAEQIKRQPYDPEAVWNIEGPTRKKTDAEKKAAATSLMKQMNESQRHSVAQRKSDAKSFDLSEGKKLVENDMKNTDLDRQLRAFKKQLFAQELLATWESQNSYKKKMKMVEDEC